MAQRINQTRSIAGMGAQWGAFVASGYLLTLLLLWLIPALITHPSWEVIVGSILFLSFGSFIGIPPAMILGMVTAVLMKWRIQRAPPQSRGMCMVFGGMIAGGMSCGMSVLYMLVTRSWQSGDFAFGYLFYMGVPSLLYILASVWFSWYLWPQYNTSSPEIRR